MAAAQVLDFAGKTADQVKASLKRYRTNTTKAVAGLADVPEGVPDEAQLAVLLTMETSLARLRSCVEQCYTRHIELLAEARVRTRKPRRKSLKNTSIPARKICRRFGLFKHENFLRIPQLSNSDDCLNTTPS